jgi:hypothetical protein
VGALCRKASVSRGQQHKVAAADRLPLAEARSKLRKRLARTPDL